MTDEQPSVLTERTGHTLAVTLDRPAARNAVDARTRPSLAALRDRDRAIGQSADAMEGIVALIERRAPSWTAS